MTLAATRIESLMHHQHENVDIGSRPRKRRRVRLDNDTTEVQQLRQENQRLREQLDNQDTQRFDIKKIKSV